MVIGSGLVAKLFESKYKLEKSFTIFASGVSNSKCTDYEQYERESRLLQSSLDSYSDTHFVYFSTCSIYDESEQQSLYVKHKLQMEKIVKQQANKYTIFRVSNIVGNSSNSNTVLNFLVNQVKQQKKFELWVNSERNFIDADDLFLIADYTLQNNVANNCTINIANTKNYSTKYVLGKIEEFFKKEAICELVEKGSRFDIDTQEINSILEKLNIHFEDNYLEILLDKYYKDANL